MGRGLRAPRPYKGGKRGVVPHAEHPVPPPGQPGGPGRFEVGLAVKHDVTHELRIPKGLPHAGEWTDRPNPATFALNGMNADPDTALDLVGDTFSWDKMDKQLARKADLPSVRTQHLAQIRAKSWASQHEAPQDIADVASGMAAQYSAIYGDNYTPPRAPQGDDYAALFWAQYQNPQDYQQINHALRTPGAQDNAWVNGQIPQTEDQVRSDVDRAFAEGGWTTTEPTTLYRALKTESGGPNWAQTLKPGVTFTDTGMVSTTAHSKAAQGWLYNNADGSALRERTDDDVVMKIITPTGTRVLGGDPQFIETMLKPGSRFKVLSAEKKAMHGAVNPLGGGTISVADQAKAAYTEVTVELLS